MYGLNVQGIISKEEYKKLTNKTLNAPISSNIKVLLLIITRDQMIEQSTI